MNFRFQILVIAVSAAMSSALRGATPPLDNSLAGWQVWPSSGERIYADTLPPPTVTNAVLGLVSARGATVRASFALRSSKALSDVTLWPTALSCPTGGTFPRSAIDLRIVKLWYQDANAWFAGARSIGNAVLVPELLVHDDAYVTTDPATKANRIGGMTLASAAPGGVAKGLADLPPDVDVSSLRPFALAANETRQFCVSLAIPADALPGLYTGRIDVSAAGTSLGSFDVRLRIVPHVLPPAQPRFSGDAPTDGREALPGRSPAVAKPKFPNRFLGVVALPRALTTRLAVEALTEAGIAPAIDPSALPDVASLFRGKIPDALWVAPEGALAAPATAKFSAQEALAAAKCAVAAGAADARVFLPTALATNGAALLAVDDAGARAWVVADFAAYKACADVIRAPMQDGLVPDLARQPRHSLSSGAYGDTSPDDTRQIDRWHAIGTPNYLLVSDGGGIENPAFWRRRVGLECFYHGFDGFVIPTVIEPSDPWNDWALRPHRSRTLLYPTKGGYVVPTLAWIFGVEDGLLDARYLSSVLRLADEARRLAAKTGNHKLAIDGRRASQWVDMLDPRGSSPDTMRLDAIAWIVRLEALIEKEAK